MGILSPSVHSVIIPARVKVFNTVLGVILTGLSRVIVYVDGFNLYYGLRDAHGHKYMWLDVEKLALSLLKPYQTLIGVKYFTSLVRDNPGKQERQQTYLDALRETTSVQLIFGKYKLSSFRCPACLAETQTPSEKMTDVNISVALITDAVEDKYETALLITGDSDLTPAVSAIRNLATEKRIVVVFPPRRNAFELIDAANASFVIGRKKLADCQLPETVLTTSGFELRKPENRKQR
jgi:uncharacterized LabA/DUF88 family protein